MTGVQTCALPISGVDHDAFERKLDDLQSAYATGAADAVRCCQLQPLAASQLASDKTHARHIAADRAAAKQAHRRASDRERLDTLLDKINDHGLQSLSEAERKELVDLRNRLRGDA